MFRGVFHKNSIRRSVKRPVISMFFLLLLVVLFTIFVSLTGCGITEGKAKDEITISCYYDTSNFLNEAVKMFNEKHLDIKVGIEYCEPPPMVKTIEVDGGVQTYTFYGADEQAEKDYILRTNTEIMSGKGADIYQIDILPYYKYADGGYIEDLSAFMDNDPDFNKTDYRMNVLDAVKYKGGQYTFPMSFTFNFFAYDKTLITVPPKNAFTFEELIDLAEDSFNGNNYIYGLTGDITRNKGYTRGLWEPLLEENYAGFVDIVNKKAYFDDGRFERLLQLVTEYSEKGYLWTAADDTLFKTDVFLGVPIISPEPDERFFYKYEMFRSLQWHFERGTHGMMPSYSEDSFGDVENDIYAGLAADYNGNAMFNVTNAGWFARHTYAINSGSKNKDAAWAFLKFLASYEMQSKREIGDIPINKTAFEEKMKLTLTEGEFFPLDSLEWAKDYINFVNKLSDEVNTCVLRDHTIDKFIEDEVILYFDGKKTAKDTALALQNKAWLYLNE